MELLLQKFFSIYFIVMIVMSVLWMVIKILRNLLIDKTIERLLHLPDDRKERIIRLYRGVISSQRIMLWITPFGFLFVLAALLLLFAFPSLAVGFDVDIRQFVIMGGILVVVAYIHFLEDSAYKKKILKALDKS
jgi:hypothetical protein